MRGAYERPKETCPYCGGPVEAEYVDVGVGYQQVTPHTCEGCHAVEIDPFDERTYSRFEGTVGFWLVWDRWWVWASSPVFWRTFTEFLLRRKPFMSMPPAGTSWLC